MYVYIYVCMYVYVCLNECIHLMHVVCVYVCIYISVYLCLYICLHVCTWCSRVYRYPLFVDEVRLLQFGLLHRPRREEGQRAVGRADSEEVAKIRHPQNAIPGRVRSWVYVCMYVCMYVCIHLYGRVYICQINEKKYKYGRV